MYIDKENKMKKLLYISNVGEDVTPGYKEKIRAQTHAFAEAGLETYLYTIQKKQTVLYKIINDDFIILQTDKFDKYGQHLMNKIFYRFIKKKNNIFFSKVVDMCDSIQPDYVYLRRVLPLSKRVHNILAKISNKGVRVIYEYPTFPWEQEMKETAGLRFDRIVREKYYAKRIDKYIYRYAVILGDNVNLSPKYIEISNGYNVNGINRRIPLQRASNSVELLVVAHLMDWHGIDRLIISLSEYYKYRYKQSAVAVNLNIIGEGIVLPKLRELVDKLNLNDFVKFYGKKTGSDLDAIYDSCDIGVGSLGMHRIGLSRGSTLKLREYCAKGIPFIYAYDDFDFDNCSFALKISNSEKVISIEDIINFHNSNDYMSLVNEMRNFAEKNLTWSNKMKPVTSLLTNQ